MGKDKGVRNRGLFHIDDFVGSDGEPIATEGHYYAAPPEGDWRWPFSTEEIDMLTSLFPFKDPHSNIQKLRTLRYFVMLMRVVRAAVYRTVSPPPSDSRVGQQLRRLLNAKRPLRSEILKKRVEELGLILVAAQTLELIPDNDQYLIDSLDDIERQLSHLTADQLRSSICQALQTYEMTIRQGGRPKDLELLDYFNKIKDLYLDFTGTPITLAAHGLKYLHTCLLPFGRFHRKRWDSAAIEKLVVRNTTIRTGIPSDPSHQ